MLKEKFARWRCGGLMDFAACRRGSAALLFALSAGPLLLGCGGAMDFGRAYAFRAQLDNALKAAAGAYTHAQESGADPRRAAFSVLDAYGASFPAGAESAFAINDKEQPAALSASAAIKTAFLPIFGVERLQITRVRQLPRTAHALHQTP